MQNKPLKMLDLTLYNEKLDNGLDVYILPKNNYKNIFAFFTTKYGSIHNEFVPIGKKKMIKVPDGIAHFLEHKLFEQKNGVDPFAFFDETGAECNASTSYFKTSYWFSGAKDFKKNINFLLDFVQEPYFTDKNVKKEQGIIEQEIDMYKDDPYRVGFEKGYYNVFANNPARITTGGTKESINKITKEDLYTCYNTFYNPSNMILFISGNVDPDETLEIIKKNQSSKNFSEENQIEIKKIDEPKNITVEKEVIKMNVTIPKIFINYKIDVRDINYEDKHLIMTYLSIFLDNKIGATSLFYEKIKQEKMTNTDIYYSFLKVDDYIVLTIECESNQIDLIIDEIENEIKNLKVLESDFNRKKKTILSSCIFMSDNIYGISNKLINDLVIKNKIDYDLYDTYKNLSYGDFKKIMEEISFKERSIVIIEPE